MEYVVYYLSLADVVRHIGCPTFYYNHQHKRGTARTVDASIRNHHHYRAAARQASAVTT